MSLDQVVSMEVCQIEDKQQLNEQQSQISNPKCPYLDTIDRRNLDFDFEKICTKSLAKTNVYACLVCGKYFQGRGKSSHAFAHSVSEFHHIFLNLDTLKCYALPDNYEIIDDSLNDIKYYLKPTFTQEEIDKLDTYDKPINALNGKSYYLGMVGLNNLKSNDYCNVVFQALGHVRPIRNYFLIEANCNRDDLLLHRYGELVRKLWNPRNFKTHVSPHEMLQAIALVSKKKFEITQQNDPIVFLIWFLNALFNSKQQQGATSTTSKTRITMAGQHPPSHGGALTVLKSSASDSKSTNNANKSTNVVRQTFEGQILVKSRLILPNIGHISEQAPQMLLSDDETCTESGFFYLTLELPGMPLFPKKDEKGKVIQPRVGVYELLSKYNGVKTHEYRGLNENSIRRYEIVKLPKYLILYYKRLTKNAFFIEKNTHIVDLPLTNLDMSSYLTSNNTNHSSKDISSEFGRYNLLVNIIHDGQPQAGKGTYRAHIRHRGSGKWFELQDLYVTEVSDLTRISISESYIQIWESVDECKLT